MSAPVMGQRLRAPRQDRAILAEPPLETLPQLLAANADAFQSPLDFLGQPWAEMRREARQAALDASSAYFHETGEPLPTTTGQLMFVAGHQPEMFHPGVWVKNFALAGLARRQGATPLNLVVDNDNAKSTVLHVPHGPRRAALPFDDWQGDVPFEERRVVNEGLFASLPERVRPLVEAWPYRPFLESYWREVLEQAKRTPLLGERLARARRAWERRWGAHAWEVPLSRVCRTEPFARFACHLLANMPRLHADYNGAVHDYRVAHGIRSTFHPVPDLARDGDWFEAPFWAWQEGQSRRGRLFVRGAGANLDLRVGDAIHSLPAPSKSPASAIAHWLQLARAGVKMRTRALTTTMFSRLFLGDVFLHGIGGGKYDEVTDALIARFYGLTPPRYLVLSATLLLPLPTAAVTSVDVADLARTKRDLWWNPQRHLPPDQAGDLQHEKQHWIDVPTITPAARAARYARLREVTQQLRPFTADEYRRTLELLTVSQQALAVKNVARRRDYSFTLYPEEHLREFLASFLT